MRLTAPLTYNFVLILMVHHCIVSVDIRLMQTEEEEISFQKEGSDEKSNQSLIENGFDPVAFAQVIGRDIFSDTKENDGFLSPEQVIKGFKEKNPSATKEEINYFTSQVHGLENENAKFITLDELVVFIVKTYEKFPEVKSFKPSIQEEVTEVIDGNKQCEIKAQNMANKIFTWAKTETSNFVTNDEAINGFKSEEKEATPAMIRDFSERVNDSEFGAFQEIRYGELTDYLLRTYKKQYKLVKKLAELKKKGILIDPEGKAITITNEIFGIEDDDHNSYINSKEALEGFKKMNPNYTKEEMEEFNKLLAEDRQDNGMISKDELKGFFTKIYTDNPDALDKDDASLIEINSKEKAKIESKVHLQETESGKFPEVVQVPPIVHYKPKETQTKDNKKVDDSPSLLEIDNEGNTTMKVNLTVNRTIVNFDGEELDPNDNLEKEARKIAAEIFEEFDTHSLGYIEAKKVDDFIAKNLSSLHVHNTTNIQSLSQKINFITLSELEDYLAKVLQNESTIQAKSTPTTEDNGLESYKSISKKDENNKVISMNTTVALPNQDNVIESNNNTSHVKLEGANTQVKGKLKRLIASINSNGEKRRTNTTEDIETNQTESSALFKKNLEEVTKREAEEYAKNIFNKMSANYTDLVTCEKLLHFFLELDKSVSSTDLKDFQVDLVLKSKQDNLVSYNQVQTFFEKMLIRDANDSEKDMEMLGIKTDYTVHSIRKGKIDAFAIELVEKIFSFYFQEIREGVKSNDKLTITHSQALVGLMKFDPYISNSQLKDFQELSIKNWEYKDVLFTKRTLYEFITQMIKTEKEDILSIENEFDLDYDDYNDL